MKKGLLCLLCTIAVLNATVANAFKIDTHVWVGQQVINDLEDDGLLTFKLRGQTVTIPVRADVRSAILNNKRAFLTGNIGPDAMPDIVAGQFTAHPGVQAGWRAHHWMEYLLGRAAGNPEATAYAYGYLGHAAADVFAHTYVNQYAGDQFWITDGETLVEQRHFVLESFISIHTPPSVNYQGSALGARWQQVGISDTLGEFLRDAMVYDPQVVAQYRLPDAFSPHLAAYADFRKGIDQFAEDPRWHDLDAFAVQVIASYFDINLSDEEASAIVDGVTPVLQFLNGDLVDEVQSASNQLYDGMRRYDATLFGTAADAVQRMQNAESAWVSKMQEKRRKLAELVTPPSCPRAFGIPLDPACEATRSAIIETNKAILRALEFIENQLLDLKQDLIQAANEVHDEAQKAADALRVMHNGILDFSQIPGQGVLPFQPALRAWRADIDVAMREYVKATTQMLINAMDENPASVFSPLEDWFNCYHLQIISVSSNVSSCEFRDAAASVVDSGKRIIDTIDWAQSIGARIGIPSPTEIQNFIDYYQAQLIASLREVVTDEITSLLPQDIRDLVQLFDQNVDDNLLNTFFTKPESGVVKKVVMIPDMATRVRKEMRMTGNYFDPQKYAVAYDAVQLAKLALLDRAGLDTLAAAAGVQNSSGGTPLFAGVDNAVASAFDVLDGNHQWMPNGADTRPPRPNSTKPFDKSVIHAAQLVPALVSDYASGRPFVPWNDSIARSKLFRAMFIGPLSPGIDAPQTIGMSRLLAPNYPYQPCSAQPFPNDNKDRTCLMATLGPVLEMLTN